MKSLALWRIALGASCLKLMLLRWGGLSVFYAENGAYPVGALRPELSWENGPLRWVTSSVGLHLSFALCCAVALAFTLGLRVRVVKWLLLPALFVIDARAKYLFTGGEAVLHGQALFAAFLPLGQVWSIDAWRSSRLSGSTPNAEPTAIRSPLYPLLLLQLAVIYFFNGRAKSGVTWQDGSALVKTLGAPSLVTDFGAWVAHWPPVVLQGMTHGTLVVEGALPLLLLSPWGRKWTHPLAGLLMISLHVGIHVALQIGSFSLAMLSYLPLLWHPRAEGDGVRATTRRTRWLEAVTAAGLLYIGAGRLSRDLILWPERPQLPMPKLLDRATTALGLLQPWMMFSPDPPERDYVIVTDAVTSSGLHFDPWQRAAIGKVEPLTALPLAVARGPSFANYEIYLSRAGDARLRSAFAAWVNRQPGPDGAAVEHFDVWSMVLSANPERVVDADRLDAAIGVQALPFDDALAIKGFDAWGVWAPERAFDRKIVPEGTNVVTPVSAVMSAGCPHIKLDFGEPRRIRSAYLQADSADLFWIEGSLDNQTFHPLAQMPRLKERQHRSRVIALPGDEVRYVRIRPVEPRGFRHFLSEAAFFERAVALPPLTARLSEDFYAALGRPGVVGIVSGSRAPTCDAEKLSRAVAH